LGPPEALAVLAKHAEPGSMMKRRSVLVRVAAIEGLSTSENRRRAPWWSSTGRTRTRRAAGGGGGAQMTTRAAKPQSDSALAQEITREVAKRVVGQEVMVERLIDRFAHRRPHIARRRARARQDAGGAHRIGVPADRVLAHPVHARPPARGRDRHDDLRSALTGVLSQEGPAVRHLVLADEINRAPPRCSRRCSKRCRKSR